MKIYNDFIKLKYNVKLLYTQLHATNNFTKHL